MPRYKGVGCHVFAGGFTHGVQQIMDVDVQLETHGPFGEESAAQNWGVEWINDKNADWPDVTGDFLFGNPRCTGFSTITAGYGEDCHGAWSKQTCDIHQLCEYSAGRFPIVIWESVQQAMSTGRELLDHLRDEVFAPKGYRIAHISLNAASFGNSQQRKRYFFVAYDRTKNFNVVPPTIDPYFSTMYDAIWADRFRTSNEIEKNSSLEYDRDTYYRLTDDEKASVPLLPNGWNMNLLARYAYVDLPEKYKETWDLRNSDMPFSMHCVYRCNWLRPSPTLHSSACRFIHPDHHRPLTVGELSRIMGWGDHIPRGPQPVAQLAKGVVPQAGRWLAEQVKRYLNDDWGSEDWFSSYCDKTSMWVGGDANGALEKSFDLTKYCSKRFDMDRYDLDVAQRHRFNIDPDTGQLKKPWKTIVADRLRSGQDLRRYGDHIYIPPDMDY